MLLVRLELILLQLATPVLHDGAAERTVEAHIAFIALHHLSNAADHNAPDRHFLLKVKVALIRQLIQTHSDSALVTHLHEATRLG